MRFTLAISYVTLLILCLNLGSIQAQNIDSTQARLLLRDGIALIEEGKFDSAIHKLTSARELYAALQKPEGWLKAETGYGKALRQKSNYSEALEVLDAAVKRGIQTLGEEHLLVARARYQVGVVHFYLHAYDQALEYYMKARETFEKLLGKTSVAQANTCSSIALCWSKKHDLDKAIDWYNESLDSYAQADSLDHPWAASTFNSAGVAYEQKGDYKQALEFYQKALKILEKQPKRNLQVLSSIYNNMGVQFQRKEDFAKAIHYFQMSRELYETQFGPEHPFVGRIIGNLGVSYFNKGDTASAWTYTERAMNIFLKSLGPQHPILGFSYNNMGQLHKKMGHMEEAISYYRKTLDLYQGFPSPKPMEMALAMDNLAEIYAEMGDPDKALSLFKQALSNRQERFGTYHSEVAKTHLHMGNFFAQQGKHVAAMEQYDLAIAATIHPFLSPTEESIEEVFHKPILLLSLMEKAELLRTQGEGLSPEPLNMSLKVYELASSLIDNLRYEYQSTASKIVLQENAHRVYQGAIKACLELHARHKDAGFLTQAFQYIERSRAVLLQESLRESEALQYAGLPQEILAQEEKLRKDLAYYEKQVFDERQKGEAGEMDRLRYLKDKRFELREAYDSLVGNLEQEFPAYYQLKYQTQVPDPEQVQEALPDEESYLIAYYLLDSSLLIFTIGKEAWEAREVPLKKDFSSLLNSFVQELKDPIRADQMGNDIGTYQQFLTKGSDLYQQLVAPALSLEGKPLPPGSKLILIPDGILGYLPFGILPMNQGNSLAKVDYPSIPYLFTSYIIRYGYAAGFLIDSYATTEEADQAFAGFAPEYGNWRDPNQHFSPNSLYSNQSEVTTIHQLMGGDEYLGEQANETFFKQLAGKYQVLHLAMHAFTNDLEPSYSGLVFSQASAPEQVSQRDSSVQDDGILYSYELFNLSLHAELAVLSACNTGTGTLARGEGINSLARAFRFAGCPSILMSLWQADDMATREFMVHFYRHLKDGKPKDKALQLARLDFLQSTSLKHPHYWAPFVLNGEGSPLSPAPSRTNWTWGILLGLLLILGALAARWYYR